MLYLCDVRKPRTTGGAVMICEKVVNQAKQCVTSFALNVDGLPDPPTEILRFIEEINAEMSGVVDPVAEERRSSARHNMIIVVGAIELDESFVQVGTPFLVRSRNISTNGIALVHTRAITSPYLGIQLELTADSCCHVIVAVRHCAPQGRFYEIGGQFLAKANL